MNTKNNKVTSAIEDSAVPESKKMKDVTEALNILLAEKETREKGDKIKRVIWIAMLVMILYNTFIFFSLYRYYTSSAFLDELKYRAIETMPTISQELGKTAEKSAPILFEQLKGQFEAYLPVMKDKILDQHKQLVEQAITMTRQQFDSLIQAELDAVMNKVKSNGGMNLTPEQLDQLQKAMAERASETMDVLITKNVGEQLNKCIAGAESLKTFSASLDKATRDL